MKKLIILLFNVFLSVGCGKKDANNTQSVEKTRLAADQGDAEAQNNLGVRYADGRGVPQDDVQAVKWFRLAADQGNAKAQTNLGLSYYFGKGVTQDAVQALMWSNLAAAQGHAYSAENRDFYVQLMSPQQIERAQELARNWKPKKK
jgi:TPR repeat protein